MAFTYDEPLAFAHPSGVLGGHEATTTYCLISRVEVYDPITRRPLGWLTEGGAGGFSR